MTIYGSDFKQVKIDPERGSLSNWLNKNEILLLEDFSDYKRFPKIQPIDNRLDVNERFSIIIDNRNNTRIYTG